MARRDTSSTAVVGDDFEPVEPPVVDEEGIPSKCLSFVIKSDWGHFRRIDRTVTKQTYRLPPRTTIAGILAAIAGVRRDGYYDIFGPDVSAMAVTPLGQIRTLTQPTLGLGTHPGETMDDAGGTGGKTLKVKYPDSTDNRQIHSYELLVDPTYRIDIAVEDERFYTVLANRLKTGTSYYPPSMGMSEFLAWITPADPAGGFEQRPERIEASDTVVVNSAIPNGVDDIVPRPDVTYQVERVPGYMESHGRGRRTTGFVDYALSEEPIEIRPNTTTPVDIGGHVVVFE